MARTREFDRDVALERAMRLFWEKGYAATSLDELLGTMEIGRQSLYNTFGDKRKLYLETLGAYQRRTIDGHLRRLKNGADSLKGIEALLLGLIAKNPEERVLGCMGVGSASEFGTVDAEVAEIRSRGQQLLQAGLIESIRQGQASGEIDSSLDAEEAAGFVALTMTGLQLAARAGGAPASLRAMARFAVDRLKAG